MLCVFIAVCGRGGGPLPATNGLLENTDSYASPCGELWRKQEKGEDLERRLRESGFWRESGGRHQVDTETEFKVLIRLEAVTNNEICTSRLFWEENKTKRQIHREWKLRSFLRNLQSLCHFSGVSTKMTRGSFCTKCVQFMQCVPGVWAFPKSCESPEPESLNI